MATDDQRKVMKPATQRSIVSCQIVAIPIAMALFAGSASETFAQITPDSIDHKLDLRDAALMLVRAERVQRASRELQNLVQNEGGASFSALHIRHLASEFKDPQYRTTYLLPPQGSDSVIAHVVLVEHLASSPIREAIVAFDRQQRPYRLRGFDSSDFSLLISRIFPATRLPRRDKAPEILRLFLELQLHVTPLTSRLIVDTTCLSTIGSVPVHAPQYRFDTGRIDIEFFLADCYVYSPIGPQLSQHRLWETEDGLFEYKYMENWEVDDCWCKDK